MYQNIKHNAKNTGWNRHLKQLASFIWLPIICLGFNYVSAQICVGPNLTITSVSGVVVLTNQTIIHDIKVQLRSDLPKERPIAETKTDNNGHFNFKGIRPGKYRLVIERVEGLVNLAVGLHLRKRNPSRFPVGLKVTMATLGDCSNAVARVLKKGPFDAVSSEYRERLLSESEIFLRDRREKRFDQLYAMLTPYFRQSNKKDDFVNNMNLYYSGNNRFISFLPTTVTESLSPTDRKPGIWTIEGCLIEVINGKQYSIKTSFQAIREAELIFYTDLGHANPPGDHEKCKG